MIITLTCAAQSASKEYEYGGKIEVYEQVDQTTDDFARIYACCDYFAKQGAKTLIYPHFARTIGNPIYHEIFASLVNTRYWGRCPDFTVSGVCLHFAQHKWFEHEGYDDTKDLTDREKRGATFCAMVRRGIRQSDRLVVEDCGFGRFYAKRTTYKRVHFQRQNISEVFVRTAEGLELLYTCTERSRSRKEEG
jgi:hypothetical protein